MAKDLLDLLTSATKLRLGDDATCSLNPPLPEHEWLEAKSRLESNVQTLHPDLITLWRHCDGGDFFGLSIVGAQEADALWNDEGPDHKAISFHNWGNGDFTYLVHAGDPVYSEGSVIGSNHDGGRGTALIAPSLAEWLRRAIDETKRHGGVFHQWDYQQPGMNKVKGLYRPLFEKFKD